MNRLPRRRSAALPPSPCSDLSSAAAGARIPLRTTTRASERHACGLPCEDMLLPHQDRDRGVRAAGRGDGRILPLIRKLNS
uniref:Uncharacterized protein n=1 Tax=Oryza rufipogon TaxID=4529 RepID=A0A0E0PCI0_ORYRU